MAERVEFKRNIGLFMAVMIGIGAMMGPGIFALPGELARMVGPLGILVYLAMGMMTVFTALNYSELGAAIPIAGGGYSFVSRTLPAPLAFLTGWFFWIGNTLACSMYAVIFALTLRGYFFPNLNLALTALVTTVVFAGINLWGMSEALGVITVMNLVELGVLVTFAVLGAARIEPANLTPVAPFGLAPFPSAMALIYISYVGFELITVASEEIITPGKTIPRAILITLGAGTLVYVAVVWVMMGAVPAHELGGTDVPFIFAADRLFGGWGRWAAITATIMASLSAFSVTLGASARVLYALGRDGHFPRHLAQLHRRFRTPHVALVVCAVLVVVFSSSGIVKLVASISDFGYLMGLGLVNLSVIALHRRMPNLRRPFDPLFFPWIPIIGVLTCWLFVPPLELRSLALGGALTAAGSVVYLLRPSNRPSRERMGAALARLRLSVEVLRRHRMRVLIIGGESLGQNIAKRLLARDEVRLMFRSSEHQLTFIEDDEGVCQELENRFSVPTYHGDGTKREVLEQVGLANIDVAIAASSDDGRNVIAALQLRSMGASQVIAVVQDPDYVPLLEEEGIVALSAPWATAAMVENVLDRPGIADLFEIGSGVASLVSVTVPGGSQVAGFAIRDIEIPKECVVAAVIRGKKFVVPRGDTVIEAADQVVFVGPTPAVKRARDHFLVVG